MPGAPPRPSYAPSAPIAKPARQFPARAPATPAADPGTDLNGARSLTELGALLGGFDGCGLKTTAKNLCFYRGAPSARLMIIGEAPGREEDLEGKPFVGRAGQLLDKMLAAIGLKEQDVHITNVVYWRPPGNRTPTPQESQVCRPFLERQMELVGADVMLLLGGAAAKQVLGTADGIMRIRGKWREVEMRRPYGARRWRRCTRPALRTPAAKRHVVARSARRQGGGPTNSPRPGHCSHDRLDEPRPFIPVRIAIADGVGYAQDGEDKSATAGGELIAEASHTLAGRAIVTDDKAAIRAQRGQLDRRSRTSMSSSRRAAPASPAAT